MGSLSIFIYYPADHDMIEARKKFNALSRAAEGMGTWAEQPLTDEFNSIKMVLNEYELVAIGLQRGIFETLPIAGGTRTA
jgi:hypothetical protein